MIINKIKDMVGNNTIYITGHKITDVDSYVSTILIDKFLKHYGLNSKPVLLIDYSSIDAHTRTITELCECDMLETCDIGQNDYVFMVDHNNPNESIGINGKVVGIVDHHQDEGFDAVFKVVKESGSTTKIIYELFLNAGIELSYLDKKKVLYSLSVDTCALLSTKAKDTDKLFFDILLKELSVDKHRVKKETLFQTDFKGDFDNILGNGYKEYVIDGYSVGTSYVECLDNHYDFGNIAEDLFKYINSSSKHDLYVLTEYDYLYNRTWVYTFGKLSKHIGASGYECIASRGNTILPELRKKIRSIAIERLE